MNRDEKNFKTYQKILDSALCEFGTKSYGEASMNTICANGNISKGIIYHYFKDKDELYLICVKKCFDSLTEYLNGIVAGEDKDIQKAVTKYFDARIAFFNQNPIYLGIFFSAVINPPQHLTQAIEQATLEFKNQAVQILTQLLQTVKLCGTVTVEQVIEVFCEYQNFANASFKIKQPQENMLKEHEMHCRRLLQIFLYGIVEREM